jgi:acetoacetate decarboxylase
MKLEGFTRPFSPGGVASVLPPPPYDFSMAGLKLTFRADPAALAALLPPPLEPHPERIGQAMFNFVDHLMTPVNVSAEGWHPERLRMIEAYVGVPCVFRGEPGTYFPYSWTDREWSLVMEWLSGMCGRLARLSLTEMQPQHPVLNGPRPGARYTGTVERFGERVATARVSIEEQVDTSSMPMMFRTYCIRHIPDWDVNANGRPLVHQLTMEQTEDAVVEEVWRGTGELTFNDAENEWLMPIQPLEVIEAFHSRFRFRSGGMQVLYDYLKED